MPELKKDFTDSLSRSGLGDAFTRSASPNVNIAQLSTPSGVLQTIKDMASTMEPLPAGMVLVSLAKGAHKLDSMLPPDKIKQATGEMTALLAPYLYDDAQLSGKEIVKFAAELANKVQNIPASPAIVNEAAGVLKDLKIDDPEGKLAQGLGKAAVAGAISGQTLDYTLRDILNQKPAIATTPDEQEFDRGLFAEPTPRM